MNVYSCHLLFDHFQFALIYGPNIPGSYAILLFTASDFASITNHNWVLVFFGSMPSFFLELFLYWSLVAYLGTYPAAEFIFQCPIFSPFRTVHGVLKARILKWFAIPSSSGPHSVRPLHHDWSILAVPTQHGLVSLS